MRYLCLASFSLFLFGCSLSDAAGVHTNNIRERCLSGVVYYFTKEDAITGYKGYGYMSPKFDVSGGVVLCGENYEG